MTIQKARELLGDKAKGKSDREIQKDIGVSKFFANLMFDRIENMSAGERKRIFRK